MKFFTEENSCTPWCATLFPPAEDGEYVWCETHHTWWSSTVSQNTILSALNSGVFDFPKEISLEERNKREADLVRALPHEWTRVTDPSEIPYHIQSQL